MFNGYDAETALRHHGVGVRDDRRRAQSSAQSGAASGHGLTEPARRLARIDIDHPRSVLNLMREHYSRYTPEMVERITGIPQAQFLEVAKLVGEMGRPDKVMTQVYAVGLTHHTTGVADDPRGRGAPAAARQHRAARRRHERRARAREHPGQHRQRDLVGDPARATSQVPAPGQRTIDDYVEAERAEEGAPERAELLRRELREVPGQPAQGLVRRQGHQGQRVRIRLPAQAGRRTRPGSRSSTRRSRARWRA